MKQLGAFLMRLPDALPLSESEIQQVCQRAAGNPFFALQLARFPTVPCPPAIQVRFEAPFRRLSLACQHALCTAALLGVAFTFSQIALLLCVKDDVSEDQLRATLAEALQHHFLRESQQGALAVCTFRPPLLIPFLVEHLSLTRRARLGQRIAELKME